MEPLARLKKQSARCERQYATVDAFFTRILDYLLRKRASTLSFLSMFVSLGFLGSTSFLASVFLDLSESLFLFFFEFLITTVVCLWLSSHLAIVVCHDVRVFIHFVFFVFLTLEVLHRCGIL